MPRLLRTAFGLSLVLGLVLLTPSAFADEPSGDRDQRGTLMETVSERGFLGVELIEITPSLRQHYGAGADRGVLLGAVRDDSPASAAGLQVGDVLLAVDGEPAASVRAVSRLVRKRSAGDVMRIDLVRDGRSLGFDVTLAARPAHRINIGALMRDLPDDTFDSETVAAEVRAALAELDGIEIDTMEITSQAIEQAIDAMNDTIESGALEAHLEAHLDALGDFDMEAFSARMELLQDRLEELEDRLETERTRRDREER
ncbi:MAG: PDZ domain-containing protein [Acidobacteriota bacterium]